MSERPNGQNMFLPDPTAAERMASLAQADLNKLLAEFTDTECNALMHDWRFWARSNQLPPVGDWLCWLVFAGRGFGKTRRGVECVRGLVQDSRPYTGTIGRTRAHCTRGPNKC